MAAFRTRHSTSDHSPRALGHVVGALLGATFVLGACTNGDAADTGETGMEESDGTEDGTEGETEGGENCDVSGAAGDLVWARTSASTSVEFLAESSTPERGLMVISRDFNDGGGGIPGVQEIGVIGFAADGTEAFDVQLSPDIWPDPFEIVGGREGSFVVLGIAYEGLSLAKYGGDASTPAWTFLDQSLPGMGEGVESRNGRLSRGPGGDLAALWDSHIEGPGGIQCAIQFNLIDDETGAALLDVSLVAGDGLTVCGYPSGQPTLTVLPDGSYIVVKVNQEAEKYAVWKISSGGEVVATNVGDVPSGFSLHTSSAYSKVSNEVLLLWTGLDQTTLLSAIGGDGSLGQTTDISAALEGIRGQAITADPTGNLVVAASDGTVFKLDATSLAQLWRSDAVKSALPDHFNIYVGDVVSDGCGDISVVGSGNSMTSNGFAVRVANPQD